ncbi:hypothetical protein PENTCL1PPCAC_25622, partial [Pristionchus entomophagus]
LSSTLRSPPLRPLIYCTFAAIFCYSLYYDVRFQPRLGHTWYLYKAVMLTNANFIIVTVYSVLQALNSIIGSKQLQSHLDFAFYIAVYPIGFVSTMMSCLIGWVLSDLAELRYLLDNKSDINSILHQRKIKDQTTFQCTVAIFWALYFFDPDFVMPEWIRNLIPEWLNQVTHTLPLIYGSIDAFLTRHKCPSWLTLFGVSVVMTFTYWGIVFGVRNIEGYWLYPIFDLLNLEWWAVVIFLVIFLYLFDISVAVFLNFIFWGKQQSESSKKQKRR